MRSMRSYLNRICATMLALACGSVQAAGPVLEAWHYGTLPLSPQRCEASFIFDAGAHSFRAVRVQAVAKDRHGQVLARFTLEPDDMGVERRNRFATASWISQHACNSEVVVVFRSANAQIEGMPTDLLAGQQLRLRRYEPMELRLPQSRERP